MAVLVVEGTGEAVVEGAVISAAGRRAAAAQARASDGREPARGRGPLCVYVRPCLCKYKTYRLFWAAGAPGPLARALSPSLATFMLANEGH